MDDDFFAGLILIIVAFVGTALLAGLWFVIAAQVIKFFL